MNKKHFWIIPALAFAALLPSCGNGTPSESPKESESTRSWDADVAICNQAEVAPTTTGEMIAADWYECYPEQHQAKWKAWNQSGKNLEPMAFTGDLHPNDVCWVERFYGKFGDSYAVAIFDHETEYAVEPGQEGTIVLPGSLEKPEAGENQIAWGVEDRYCLTYCPVAPLIYRDHEFFSMQEAVDFGLLTSAEAFSVMEADALWRDADEAPLNSPSVGSPRKREGEAFMLTEKAIPLMIADWTQRYGGDFQDGVEIKVEKIYETVTGWASAWGFFALLTPTHPEMLETAKDYYWPAVPKMVCSEATGAYASPTRCLPMLYNFYSRTFLYPDFPLREAYVDYDFPGGTMKSMMPDVLKKHLSFAPLAAA